jgi:hypothetical protein
MEAKQLHDGISRKVNSPMAISLDSFRGVLVVILCAMFAACSSDEDDAAPSPQGTHLSVSDIAGNWKATRAVFSNSQLNPPAIVDVINDGGTVTLNIQTNGKFIFAVSFPGESPDVATGTLGFEDEYLVVSYDDDPGEYEYMGIHSNANHTELSISGPAEFDFDDNGTDEAAEVSMQLTRQ